MKMWKHFRVYSAALNLKAQRFRLKKGVRGLKPVIKALSNYAKTKIMGRIQL